jgi:RimJ/RimL family protein N-acetyltransferase
MAGRFCRVVALDPAQHAEALYSANNEDRDGRMWSYLPFGPFSSVDDYVASMNSWLARGDWEVHAIIDAPSGLATGSASYMRIDPPNGSIEVGAVMYSPRLQRTPAATEAMYLMMRRVFDELGYRRYEWKCDALNEPSIKAAGRLGFQYEGTFRQSNVVKGRNRDTAWFSVIDREWPRLKAAFESWLSPDNFEADGKQRQSLRELVTSSRSALESR